MPVTREQRVATLDEATRAAREIGYPVVLKVVSDEIPHKTELGLVAVGLASDDDLARAFATPATSGSSGSSRDRPTPLSWCRNSSPTGSRYSPASRAIRISG